MKHDVIIIGGGVSGTALLYTLSKYTNLKNIGLIEKYSDLRAGKFISQDEQPDSSLR